MFLRFLSAPGRLVGPGVTLLVLGLGRPAVAEPTPSDRAAADLFFQDGKRLAVEGRFVEACPKFAQSQKLDPGVGTLLYLAECYEKTARLATAWSTFREAADQARAGQQTAREKIALDRAAALEKRMPRLLIELDADALVTGLTVRRDGAPVLNDLLGTALPLDSGPHTIDASAPGRTPWTTTVELSDGATARVKIPALAPVAPAPASAPAVTPPPPATGAPVTSAAPLPPATAASPGLSTRRTVALVAGGVGAVGVGLGTYFGLRAFSRWDSAQGNCQGTACGERGTREADQASTAAAASSVSFTVGLLGLGAGAVLWFWPSGERTTALHVGPGSVSLEGKW